MSKWLLLPRRDGQPGALVVRRAVYPPARQSCAARPGKTPTTSKRAASRHHPALSRPVSTRAGRRAALGLALPIIATGHLTTVGASASESVREIYVGALEAFPTQAFPPVDYLAW